MNQATGKELYQDLILHILSKENVIADSATLKLASGSPINQPEFLGGLQMIVANTF